ncbi:hypothetical protein KR200_001843 [Drosophila serrata]|nr:hypothetical protein KR200_001843 [Drosophila serrata]
MPPKRRRRFQGLYYHSSPPKVMPMNGQAGGQNGRKRRDNEDFSVKLSTIRIWMHEKDIGKLTRILWAGQGNRLSQQASNNGRVKRFLAAVPHVMNAIKDLHQAVIDNNLENVQSHLEPPVPSALVTCKDGNGLNVIHKAAGLGHTKILEYLVGIWPEGAHETDITGKTPLHWAASAKNNMRCYTLLTQAGCDEEAVDYKMKTPSYYRHKPHEIERAFLVYVPDAPRVSPDSVTDWEALSDETSGDSIAGGDSSSKKLDMKMAPVGNGRKSLDDSLENASELDTNDGTSANEDDDLSKADAEPEVEDIASPLQRRPETPGTFNTINGNGNGDHDNDDSSEAENIARAISGDEGEGDENGGGDAAILENGNNNESEEEKEESQAEEDELPAATEGVEDIEQPEESATESELEGNKKTEVELEPEEELEQAAQKKPAEGQEEEEPEEPGDGAIESNDVEIRNEDDKENEIDNDEHENENDDDDEVQMGVL